MYIGNLSYYINFFLLLLYLVTIKLLLSFSINTKTGLKLSNFLACFQYNRSLKIQI
jgi:hypothetical protein